ncbi:RDD family protein [Tsukamurella paurometabola]|uniref:RDD family n=1 Tax=Tsukamurella paurometabola TaxID=2061 RepID=A0A3P8L9P1_TSUPA|nr:RDD family protein [Tsukamurella paurometabola]UEA83853.1 RDD family protein [Tsukamurella paurometabola]VDR41001.1 RDD family [Tsukamurella paurometabola]
MSDQATARATQEYGAQTSLGGPQAEAAPNVLRVLAYIADLCVASAVVAVALIVNIAAGLELGWVFLGIGAAVAIIASIVLHGLYGASPGKLLAGIKVVDADAHTPIGFPASAIRSVVFNVLAPLVYLPAWSILADGGRRGVHEKASKSTVVDDADVATPRRAAAQSPSGPLGGLVTGESDSSLQRIPTPLPDETRVDAVGADAATEVVEVDEPRERLQPPTLPPLPDDVPGLRPVPPRFGPPPTEGDEPTTGLPQAAAFAPPPAQAPQQPQAPQQFAPRPSGPTGPSGQPRVPAQGQPPQGAPAGRPLPPQGGQPPQGQPQPPQGQPRPAGAPAPSGGAPIVLRFDDGHSVDVRGDGIIGREPVLPQGSDPAKITKHVLVDDTASVSKTHLLFGITRGELWVEDVGSTNGSAIAFGDSWTELTKGVRYAVEKGSVVHMGQRSFKVFGG